MLPYIGVKDDDAEEALTKFRAIVLAEAGEPSKWRVMHLVRSRWLFGMLTRNSFVSIGVSRRSNNPQRSFSSNYIDQKTH
jgi:hypothetical protein